MVGRLGDRARIRGQRDLLGKPLSFQVFNWNNEGKGHQERSGNVKWQDRISINPQVCHGRPCIKGTRVMVSVLLANLGEGETYEAIMRNYHVTAEDIQASILFAADMADDQLLSLAHGAA
jgi:uncharacterized protein (DUF433 family)